MTEAYLIKNGRTPYGRVLNLQRRWARALGRDLIRPLIWIGRHPPVITLGKRGDEEELHFAPEELAGQGVEVFSIERGGLATVHGPGQLVAYPIWPFKTGGLGIKKLVWLLEEAMIRTLAELGLEGGRSEINPGAWAGPDKIGFVGLAIKRGVVFHGLALNLNLDLRLFELIIPCGLDKVAITSARKILGKPVDMDLAEGIMARVLGELLEAGLTPLTLDEAEEKLDSLGMEEDGSAGSEEKRSAQRS